MAIVDIIIPLYNKAETVTRAVQSILEQTVTDWCLIIVDDGSTDNSLQNVRQFADPRIQIIEQENRGPGSARNRGIQEATATYIAFLDADDQWYPYCLENAL
ncbi:MAG: glycosyltransferase family 2 protein, partial [Planctomycetota bacterium]